ncbi:MAG: hypothetical protein IT301_05330 [Dehalococcoidia bacterium]|nr:hypothetical protein [Dehalococcoidia bacterium]
MSLRTGLLALHRNEAGHVWASGPALLGAAGAIALGFGAANDTGWLAITGGIACGIGILAGSLLHHARFDWQTWKRLDDLEKK